MIYDQLLFTHVCFNNLVLDVTIYIFGPKEGNRTRDRISFLLMNTLVFFVKLFSTSIDYMFRC